jgi:hypothetical protein
MTTYFQIAPEISEFVSEVAATDFAENLLAKPVPVYRTLSDLNAGERSSLFEWLKWFGMNRKPNDLSEWVKWSPRQVCVALKMNRTYLMSLVAERNKIVSEVRTWGDDAFIPHTPAVIANIVLAGENVLVGYLDVLNGDVDVYVDGYIEPIPNYVSTPVYTFVPDGNFTITGTTFLSYSSTPTYVVFKRGATTVTRTKAQIEANGGSVSDTEIFVTDGTLPVILNSDDTVIVYANSLNSNEYTI